MATPVVCVSVGRSVGWPTETAALSAQLARFGRNEKYAGETMRKASRSLALNVV